MAGRPPLPVGIHGNITTRQVRKGVTEARCYVRDADGRRRLVSRRAASKAAARTELVKAVQSRPAFERADITSESTLAAVATAYFSQLERSCSDGQRSWNTLRAYRSVWANDISQAVGNLRVREASTGRLNDYLLSTRDRLKADHRLSIKKVLTNICALAVKRGAIQVNPMREVETVARPEKRIVRALSTKEVTEWLTHLATDPIAVKHELFDFSLMALATGARISEVLAINIEDVDRAASVVRLSHRITYISGRGHVRTPRRGGKGAAATLRLPSWAVETVTRRAALLGVNDGPLFPGIRTPCRDPKRIRDAIAQVRGGITGDDGEAGAFDFLTSHTFRKTVATLLDTAGVDVRDIAEHLTHTSEKTTVTSYIARKATGREAALALEILGTNLPTRDK
jgi:integrase